MGTRQRGKGAISTPNVVLTMATMESLSAACTMTQIHLDVIAAVPRVAQCDFVDTALRAKGELPHRARAQRQYLEARQIEPPRRGHTASTPLG